MAIEAATHVSRILQGIIDELGQTHTGTHPVAISRAVQVLWAQRLGPAAPALDGLKAAEYARYISQGVRVTVLPS
jgi:hypothetical protein